jgi:BirA family transcriptional regulator, biotin operon repressor / biotin---[acetyl-CoA-carboxylase] ligase
MIKHIHVNECDSTQDLLKEQLNNPGVAEQILVSCENQISGRGRGENKWTSMPGTICFSINIKPHKLMSFTAIELSVLVARFFELKGKKLKLKWPNDLWDESLKKCGGILVQGSQNNFYAGIGLNIFSHEPEYGSVFGMSFEIDKKIWSYDLASYIFQNRYSDTELLRRDWITRCGHLNEMVKVSEGSEVYEGIFQGLGEHGEALICRDAGTLRVYNGSLRISSQA